jgi:hypothetical protein
MEGGESKEFHQPITSRSPIAQGPRLVHGEVLRAPIREGHGRGHPESARHRAGGGGAPNEDRTSLHGRKRRGFPLLQTMRSPSWIRPSITPGSTWGFSATARCRSGSRVAPLEGVPREQKLKRLSKEGKGRDLSAREEGD